MLKAQTRTAPSRADILCEAARRLLLHPTLHPTVNVIEPHLPVDVVEADDAGVIFAVAAGSWKACLAKGRGAVEVIPVATSTPLRPGELLWHKLGLGSARICPLLKAISTMEMAGALENCDTSVSKRSSRLPQDCSLNRF